MPGPQRGRRGTSERMRTDLVEAPLQGSAHEGCRIAALDPLVKSRTRQLHPRTIVAIARRRQEARLRRIERAGEVQPESRRMREIGIAAIGTRGQGARARVGTLGVETAR